MSTPLYTGKGDDGYTGVLGKERLPKYAVRTEAYGAVDEASSALGLARTWIAEDAHRAIVLQIQQDLYRLMADLATLPAAATRSPWLDARRVTWLEQVTESLGKEVALPAAFIIPGDSRAGAALDLARAIVRRSERWVARMAHENELRDLEPLRYLNRLSSLLFVLARAEDKAAGVETFTLANLEQ